MSSLRNAHNYLKIYYTNITVLNKNKASLTAMKTYEEKYIHFCNILIYKFTAIFQENFYIYTVCLLMCSVVSKLCSFLNMSVRNMTHKMRDNQG